MFGDNDLNALSCTPPFCLIFSFLVCIFFYCFFDKLIYKIFVVVFGDNDQNALSCTSPSCLLFSFWVCIFLYCFFDKLIYEKLHSM